VKLPDKVNLLQVSPTMVQVSGWASEPFVMTEASAGRNLERVRSRRSTYATVEEYERHLSVPVEAMRLMGWEIPEDKNAPVPTPVAPTPPQAAVPEQSEPAVVPNPEPKEPQTAPQMEFDFQREPPLPGPARTTPVHPGPEKSWVEKMANEVGS